MNNWEIQVSNSDFEFYIGNNSKNWIYFSYSHNSHTLYIEPRSLSRVVSYPPWIGQPLSIIRTCEYPPWLGQPTYSQIRQYDYPGLFSQPPLFYFIDDDFTITPTTTHSPMIGEVVHLYSNCVFSNNSWFYIERHIDSYNHIFKQFFIQNDDSISIYFTIPGNGEYSYRYAHAHYYNNSGTLFTIT